MRLLLAALGLLALPALAQPAPTLPNPVLPGDLPDPSVVKIGATHWASATSSNWKPVFPLLKSTNLQEWPPTGSVFPAQHPAWTNHCFWTPEISRADRKVYVYYYYAAHQAGGNLAVGVASAEWPESHDLLVNQPNGSIDAFPVQARPTYAVQGGALQLMAQVAGNGVVLAQGAPAAPVAFTDFSLRHE